jgi:dipeptidyl aminopeptidase/acylaminoacyl peptidase
MPLRLSCLAIVVLAATPTAAWAQGRAFGIEDYYRVKSVSDVHVSPDGKTILYALTTSDLPRARRTTHIWTMDADGGNPRQLTHGHGSEYAPAFSPDGKWISYVSARDGSAQIYLLPTTAGEATRLTSISTGVSDPLWSPDSKWIAFSSDVYPECNGDDACNQRIAATWANGPLEAHMADALLYRHWTQWKDGTRTHVFAVNTTTGETRDLTPGDMDSPTFQLSGPLQYDFSPDGSELAFVSNHDSDPARSTNNDIWTVSLSDPSARPTNITSSNPAYDGTPRYSPDGKYIGYRMQKQPGYESDLFRLAVYDRSAHTSTVLTESFRNWVDDLQWADDSRSLYFSAELEGNSPIERVDVASKTITPVLTDHAIGEWLITAGGHRLVYTRSSVGRPVELYAADLANGTAGTPRPLTHVNDALAREVDIRPAETMWVEGAGGAKIEVFIVKPHGFDPAKKYPLILNVHGGPQSQWMDSFRGDWQVYPGAGYVVAFPNPHGSTGYGQDFTAEISGDWGGMVFQDLMKVTDALAKLPYVDAGRMGAMGWSYGGYMMMWFEGHTNRFKAIAAMMGLFDLRSFYGGTEELWFPEWDLKGTPWESSLYERWSPSNSVKNFGTPTLVITGERDFRVPYTQSLQFFTSLQRWNIPSRLIVYTNAGHWPSWYEMALYYTAHLEWFQKYLGGGGPPWTTEQFVRNEVFDRSTGQRLTH